MFVAHELGRSAASVPQNVSGNAQIICTMKVFQLLLMLAILPIASLYSQKNDEYATITIVEQMPIFKNGNSEDFPLWLYTNLKYPQSAINDSISGKVIARFKIDTLGMVSEIEIVRGVRDDLDQESIRVLSTSPNWIPARQGHRSVSISYSVPIIFDINDQFFIKRIKSLSKNARKSKKAHNH
jgi:TonB family protein